MIPANQGSFIRFRCLAFFIVLVAVVLSLSLQGMVPPQILAALGVFGFLALAALYSSDPNGIPWRMVRNGLCLQFGLAVFVLKVPFGYHAFEWATNLASATSRSSIRCRTPSAFCICRYS